MTKVKILNSTGEKGYVKPATYNRWLLLYCLGHFKKYCNELFINNFKQLIVST